MILKGENQEIEIAVEGYEFPNQLRKNNFWDCNWLMLYCRKTIKGKTVEGKFPCFLTTELKRLQDLLEQFLNGEAECVEWNGIEPNFQLYLHKNMLLELFFYSEQSGQVPLYGQGASQEILDGVIIFRKQASYEDIQNFIQFCEDSLNKYPIRRVKKDEKI